MKPRGRSEEPRGPAAAAAAAAVSGQPRGRRDSSASSLGSGVRCACQFYQSDSLLPERDALRPHKPSSRPPSRTADSPTSSPAATMERPRPASGEHLYEPISPPPEVTKMTDKEAAKSAVAAEMSDVDMADDLADEEMLKDVAELGPRTASADSREVRFLRSALDDSVAVPDDGTEEDVAMAGPQLGDSANGGQPAADADAEAERRYMATPTPTTTTESRTDCDINTSMLDSSGLEDLPLKRGARKRMTAEPEGAQLGLQQRMRAQAGRLRSKIRGMSRPKFSMPDRPKFSMPDRPRFSLPERPKFNMPDRPRFHLPDRPRFSMPERPKFNLPDRPKFHLPERPKFHMPQRPKFTMPGAAKTPEEEGGEKKKKKKPTSSIRRPLRDRASTVSTASSQAGGHKRLFDFDFRSYPRIFDRAKRSRDYATSSPKAGPRKLTPPPQQVRVPPARKKGPVGQRWLHRFTDIKFADDEENPPELGDDEEEGGPPGERSRVPLPAHSDDDEPRTESTAPFHDKDFAYAISLERREPPRDADTRYGRAEEAASAGDSDREQRSSGSSSDRRRAGVLEEIDSDEFFLREKGISQEDVAVGRYLTSEIRDAFRSPVNALRRMDSGEADESPLGEQYRGTPDREPERPARTRSLRPHRRRHSPSPPQQPDFGTFPPARPKRHRRAPLPQQQTTAEEERDHSQEPESQQKQQEEEEKEEEEKEEEAIESQKPEPRYEDDADIDAVPAAEDDEEEAKRVEEMRGRAPPTLTLTGPQESVETQQSADERQWGMEVEDEEEQLPQPEPPQPPKRKRRSRRDLADIPSGGPRYANQEGDAGDASPARYGSEDFAAPPRYANDNFAGEDGATEGDRYANGSFAERHDRYRLGEGPSIRRYTTEDVSDFQAEEELRYQEEAEHKLAARYVNGDDYRRHSVDARLPVVNGHYTKEDWLESVQSSKHEEALALEPDYIIPGEGEGEPVRRQPPVAPRRLRRRAGGSSRGTSLADEDATSRGAESLPSEAEHEPDQEVDQEQDQEQEAAEPGYAAVVAKPRAPSRRAKPKSPRRRSLPVTPRFFSLPRRALRAAPPVRPVRNYSTLGPSRPPRRTRLQQQQQQYVEIDEPASQSVEAGEEEAIAASGADGGLSALQAGDVVERMKGRPLPPPPRPPRKQRDNQEVEDSTALPESISEAARREAEEEEPLVGRLHEDGMEVEDEAADEEPSAAEEASVATQTDPLPDDVCVEPASDEPPPTFADASTETELKEALTIQPQEEVQEEVIVSRIEREVLSEESARLKAEQEALRKAAESKPVMQDTRITASVEQPQEPPTPQPQPQPPPPEPIIIEKPVPFYVMPDADTEVELKARRLEVSELDVGRLTVGELQARKMVVSDVDSVSLQAAEFSSKTTNLAVSTLELPSGLLQELRDSLLPQQTAEPVSQEPIQTTRTEAVEVQATPVPEYRQTAQPQPTSTIPPSVGRHRLRDYESEEEEEVPVSVSAPVSRRRRHIPRPQLRHTSSDEEELELPVPRAVSRGRSRVAAGAVGSEASAAELGRQLIATCQAAAVRALNRSVQYACSVANVDSEQHRRELQVVFCGFLVAVAALVLFGFGSGKTFHYHHWDYVFPPP